jgi:hypothetical protein
MTDGEGSQWLIVWLQPIVTAMLRIRSSGGLSALIFRERRYIPTAANISRTDHQRLSQMLAWIVTSSNPPFMNWMHIGKHNKTDIYQLNQSGLDYRGVYIGNM